VIHGGITVPGRSFLFFPLALILSTPSIFAETKKEELFSKAGIQPVRVGTKAPNFSLEDLSGKESELKHYRGKVVFPNFWVTWCGPCKEEMPSKEELSKRFKEKDFVFLTSSVEYAGTKPVKEFIEKHRSAFPVLIDPGCETPDLFEVKGIPTAFLIVRRE